MMEKLDAVLPGVSKFIREILAKEHLSPEAEKQRLHYVELLDVLSLRAPPRVPAPLPSSAAAGHGKPGHATDLFAATRNASFPAGTGAANPIDEENVYNEVTDTDYGAQLARRQISIDSRGSGAYEEPVSIAIHAAPQQPFRSVAADSTAEIGGGTSEDSDTDYELCREDDGDGEDGSEQVAVPTEAGIATVVGSETILLPRVKSKKKKKSPVPDMYLKPYDALVGRQYEGEVYARSKLSWNRLYCVIAQNVLYLYKNRADMQPRVYLPLKGHDVLLIDKDKGRNNVLRISKPGTETLFVSCDTMEKANEWYKQVMAALSIPSNSLATEEVTATTFYCSRDDMFSGSSAAAGGGVEASTTAAHSTQPPIVRGSSDDGDYRSAPPVAGDVALRSGAATLPLSTPHAIRAFAPETTAYPKAAPRKVATAEGKKKGKISKLFTGSTGRKKGRLTMDLMQDYSARRLSTDPDVVISGMLAVMSPYFSDSSSKWDEARCLIRTGGSFECSRCISTDDSSPLTGEPSLLLNLSECSVESSSDKGRPLALSLFKSRSLQLTFMPCDRMQHGDWLAALFKYVDRSSRPTTTISSSSSSSSASGSGDGIIQHGACASTAIQPTDKAPADDQASAVGTARPQGVVPADGEAIGTTSSFAPLYINVEDVGKPALDAESESSDDETNYEEVDDSIAAHKPVQKVVVHSPHNSTSVRSGTICSSTAISVTAAARAGTSAGVFAPSGWKSHTSSVTSSAACSPSAPGGPAAAGEPATVTASPPPDVSALPDCDGSGGGDRVDGGDETLSVQARILHAEAMARSARLSPVPTRTKDCTPPAAVSAATITAPERTRPIAAAHVHAASAGAPAASSQASLHVPAAATGPFVHSQHLPTASALSATRYITAVSATAEQPSSSSSSTGRDRVVAATAASGAAQQDGTQVGIAPISELAPRKLAVSGGIARNRALFEASAATSSVAAASVATATTITTTTTAGSPAAAAAASLGSSGKPNGKLAAASEPRWTGYKLAVAPAITASTVPAAASAGRARRQSSSGSDPHSSLSRAPSASVVASVAVGARGGSVCGGSDVGAYYGGHSAATTAAAAAVAANCTVTAAANCAVARTMPTDCQLDESAEAQKAYANPIGDGVAPATVVGAAGSSNGRDCHHGGSISVTASSTAGPVPQPRLVLIGAAAGGWSTARLSPMPYSRPGSSASAITAAPASAGGTGSITTYTTLSSLNRRDPAPSIIEPGKSLGAANSCCCGDNGWCDCSGSSSSSSCCTTATAVGPSDASRPTIAFADGMKKSDVRVDATKTEARVAIGSMVGRLTGGATPAAAAAAVSTTSASVTVTVLAGGQMTAACAPSTAADDVRRAGVDAEARQLLLEEHRQRLAELRKQRNQLRAGRAAAPVSERSRMEVEYRMLDDRCRELERLVSELEDVNLMHIKAKQSAT